MTLLFGINLVWTSTMDSIWRRAKPSPFLVISVILSVSGMILVSKPAFLFSNNNDDDNDEPSEDLNPALGHGLAIASGLTYSIFMMAINIFGEDIHWSLWGLFDGGLTVLVCSFTLPVTVETMKEISAPFTPLIGLTVALLGVHQAVGCVSSILAYQVCRPSLVSLVAISEIPLAYVWAAIWLAEDVDGIKGGGIGCILLALIVVLYSNVRKVKVSALREENERMEGTINEDETSKNNTNGPCQVMAA